MRKLPALLLICALSVAVAAQQPSTAPQKGIDPTAPADKTEPRATVSGKVISAATGEPLAATVAGHSGSGSIPPPPPVPQDMAHRAVAPAAADPNVVTITSPFVGTFYRSPSPDAPHFVDAGSEIRPGTVLCIVEAMKLMNEIESEIAGTIVEVVATNGKPVEYGDALFRVRKS